VQHTSSQVFDTHASNQIVEQDEEKVRYLISAKWWERWRDYTNFD